MRRALIFAHYDPHGIVSDYVIHALSAYRQFFSLICFVTTADLSDPEARRVGTLCAKVIVRENVGYDFLSWRAGFEALPRSAIFDEVVFGNDSCFGPCSDLAAFWPRVADLDVDLWGASLNRQVRPHVQSFFMGFSARLLRSGFAKHFWSRIEPQADKMALILRYEVGLSAEAEANGFRIGGVVDLGQVDKRSRARAIADNHSDTDPQGWAKALAVLETAEAPNPMQLYWGEALRRGSPFLKVEVLRDNPLNANLRSIYEHLQRERFYDMQLIMSHLSRIAPARRFPPATTAQQSGEAR